MANEIGNAARNLARAPRFTSIAVVCIAIGVAVTATTFAVLNAYLLRSLPFSGGDRLYHVVYAEPGRPEPRGMTALDWRALNEVVEVADSSTRARFYLTDGTYAQEAIGLSVARGAQEMHGVGVAAGRPLSEEDYAPDAENVALIGDALWRNRFGADPNAVGGVLRASLGDQVDEGQSYRIIGVLRPDFRYAADMARDIEIIVPQRTPSRVYFVRLRDGIPASIAERRITDAAKSVAEALPPDWTVRLEPVRERYVAGLRPLLLAVTGAAALMLLIVFLNVAVLTVLRAARRSKDVAVCVALGASRAAAARAIGAEGMLICAGAVALGLGLAAFALRFLEPLIEQHLGRPAPGAPTAIDLSYGVVLANMGIGAVAALLLCVVPAMTSWPRNLTQALRQDGRSATDGRRTRRIQSALIALEIAGSLAMLCACGLMLRSAVNLLGTDLGFRSEGVVRARLAIPQRNYPDATALAGFHEQFLERISVETAAPIAMTNFPPFYAPPLQSLRIDDNDVSQREAAVVAVTSDYFSILEVALRQGRAFTRSDRLGAEPVAIVSESLARELWPGGVAIGRRLRTAEQPVARSPLGAWRTVVGVVSDVRQHHRDIDANDIYLPFLQTPNQYAPLFVRSDHPAVEWLTRLRAAANELDRAALISGVTTLEEEGKRLLAPARFLTSILTAFAVFASFVAVIGIYAVTAYAVHQRERESAIRMAVGASDDAVMRMFLKDGAVVVTVGIALGLVGALGATRLVATQLYDVTPFDTPTFALACGSLAGAALLAIWLAARGALLKSPIEVLTGN